jgi:methyl-accepting chemotaxis protein
VKLLTKFNLILLVIFGAGGFLIAQLSYTFLFGNARREVLQQAQLMLASARSVRDYTASDLSPLLQQNPGHRVHFLPETIPFYGATTTFNNLRKFNPDYTNYAYKEATLNPTNLEDRAADWEADVIAELRAHPEEAQITSERATANGPSLYIANPIKATQECLECHSFPSAAPRAMIAVYGAANGFGWKKDEIVGAQIISVPMAVPIEIANRAYHQLLLYLILTMIVAILAIDAGVYWFVIRPLKFVSATADSVSRGEKNVPPIVIQGKDEIATVAQSFNRMQLSLAKAMRMFEEG